MVADLAVFMVAEVLVDFTAEPEGSMVVNFMGRAASFTAVVTITVELIITAATHITTEVARTITAATTDTTTVVTDRITMAVTMAPVSPPDRVAWPPLGLSAPDTGPAACKLVPTRLVRLR